MTSDDLRLKARLRAGRNPRLRLILQYLEESSQNQGEVVRQLLEARFLPVALRANGQPSQDAAIECIAILKGYIYAIEQLAGVEPTAMSSTPSSFNRSASANFFDDEDGSEAGAEQSQGEIKKDAPTQPKVDFDRMLGLPSSNNPAA